MSYYLKKTIQSVERYEYHSLSLISLVRTQLLYILADHASEPKTVFHLQRYVSLKTCQFAT